MTRFADEKIIEPPPEDALFLPPDTFLGQSVLVTGGSSGMGLGMATAFARAGANVVLVGRSKEKAEAAAAELEKICVSGAKCIGVAADVRSPEQIAEAFDSSESAVGNITLLANNAGGNFPALAEKISTNAWNAISRIAIDGTFIASTEFARRLKERSQGGSIVNNSAQYIWTGFPGDAHSASAKTAVATMTRSMAKQWKGQNIRVNCVSAGMFPHSQAEAMGGDDQSILEVYSNMVPAGRNGQMQEFGWASCFLCSPFAEGITGQILMIDGGDSLRRSLITPNYVPPRHRKEIWGYEA